MFAQALLMPRDAAMEDLNAAPLNLERLAELKGKWGVSMHAIAMRAKYLEVLTEPNYRSIYETLRFRGWLRQEPGDLSTVSEQPKLMQELIDRCGLSESLYDVADRLDLGLKQLRAFLPDEMEDRPLVGA